MFDALARLADRATLPFPKYALQAMEQWASVTGRDMPVPEITVRVEPVHYPTPEEDEL